jgi:hypothetical protein
LRVPRTQTRRGDSQMINSRHIHIRDLLKGQGGLKIGGSSGRGVATATAAIAAGSIVTLAANDPRSLDAAAAACPSVPLSTRAVHTVDTTSVASLFREAGAFQYSVVTAAWTRVGTAVSQRATSLWTRSAGVALRSPEPHRVHPQGRIPHRRRLASAARSTGRARGREQCGG